jgi:flagellin-specific chaperone FliS
MATVDSRVEAARAYQAANILTASNTDVLLLAYDTALHECDRAAAGVAAGDLDIVRKAERRVTQVLLLLVSAIDPGPDPVLAGRLLTLYQWCLARLAEGHQSDRATYAKVRTVLANLRGAFAHAASAARESSNA